MKRTRNGSFINGNAPNYIRQGQICKLSEAETFEINKVIFHNAFKKCAASSSDLLDSLQKEEYHSYGAIQVFFGKDSGVSGGYTNKKEIFIYSDDEEICTYRTQYYLKYRDLKESYGKAHLIPAHYNASGEVDRFGSKYEKLIFPGFAIASAGILLLLQKYQRKKNAPELEQKVLLGTAIFTMILFIALGLFFGIAAIHYASDPAKMDPDLIVRLTSIATGVMFIVLGNLMPKARRNAIFGLRTKWSMSSDSVWQKSQRFGGFSSVVCGLSIIISAAFVPGIWSMIVLTAAALIWVAACIAASYRYWKMDGGKREAQ